MVGDPANGQWLQSYTIITTDANELMAPVHERMPVILHPGDFDRWLDRDSDPSSGYPPQLTGMGPRQLFHFTAATA